MGKKTKYIAIAVFGAWFISMFLFIRNVEADEEYVEIDEPYTVWCDSQTGRNTAYIDDINECVVNIVNNRARSKNEIRIQDELDLVNAVYDLRWLGEQYLAVIGHINPSLDYLSVYDISDMTLIDEHYGSDFQWSSEDYNSLYYIYPTPHFSDGAGTEYIMNVEEEIIYETKTPAFLNDLRVSPNGELLCVVEESEDSTSLKVINLHTSEEVKAFDISYMYEEIEWETDNLIYIYELEKMVGYDLTTGNVIEKEYETSNSAGQRQGEN